MAVHFDHLQAVLVEALTEFVYQPKNQHTFMQAESKLRECFHQREFWNKFVSRNDELIDWAVTYNPSPFRSDTIDVALKTKNSERFVHCPLTIS